MSKLEANSSKKNNSKEKPKKITELFPEVGRKIKVYKNGDPYDAGINVVLNMRKIHDIGTFLDVINDKIYLTHGTKRLYTTTGQLVKKTSELQNEREYVASSGPFIPLNYGQKALQREHSMSAIRTNSSKISRSISLDPRTKKKTTTVAEVKKEMNEHIPNGMARSKSFVQQKGAKIVKKVEAKPNANGGLPNAMPKRIPIGKKEQAEKEAKKVKKEVDGVKKIKKKKVVEHKEKEKHEEHHHENHENHKNEHKSESEQENENKRRESKISHQSASRNSSRKASPSEPEESEHSVHTPQKSSHHSRPDSTESKKSNDSRKSNHSKKSEAPHHRHSGHDSVSISSGINSQTESESDPAASRASSRNSRNSSKHSTK